MEVLLYNYGVSEIYLTEIKKPEKYNILRLKDGNSEMQSTVAYVIKSLRILEYRNAEKRVALKLASFEQDDLAIFQKIFRQRARGKDKQFQ